MGRQTGRSGRWGRRWGLSQHSPQRRVHRGVRRSSFPGRSSTWHGCRGEDEESYVTLVCCWEMEREHERCLILHDQRHENRIKIVRGMKAGEHKEREQRCWVEWWRQWYFSEKKKKRKKEKKKKERSWAGKRADRYWEWWGWSKKPWEDTAHSHPSQHERSNHGWTWSSAPKNEVQIRSVTIIAIEIVHCSKWWPLTGCDLNNMMINPTMALFKAKP